jgi:FkbM family methyltransferase
MLTGLRARLDCLKDHPVARRQRLRTLGRFARAEILNRAMNCPFLFRHDFGVTLIVDRGLHSTRGHYFLGVHEFEEEFFLLHFLGEQDLFIDVGANLGVFSILVARATGARVIAFEPSPSSAKIMKMQVALNGLADRVELHETCVGNETRQVSIKDSVDMDNAIVLDGGGTELVSVPMLKIDDVVRPERDCVMKMDVEGFEREALEGARRLLADPRLRALAVETCGICTRFGHSTDEISEMVMSNGFVPARYDPWARTVSASSMRSRDTGPEEANTFFVRSLEEARARVEAAPRRSLFGLSV